MASDDRGAASELPEGAWIVGSRWDNMLAGDELPTRIELDAVTDGHPVAPADVDGHSTWVNTRVLQLSGIDASTPDPAGYYTDEAWLRSSPFLNGCTLE